VHYDFGSLPELLTEAVIGGMGQVVAEPDETAAVIVAAVDGPLPHRALNPPSGSVAAVPRRLVM
jgi:hypothetical protein